MASIAFLAMPAVSALAASNAPPGNNGHIQIDEYTMDGGNGNDPHVSCGFSVSFFGYDGGTQQASITVTPWAPTSGGQAFTVPTSWSIASRTSGNQLDQNVPITAAQIEAAFAGVSAAHEGYHAKVEVEVTGSQGSDDKYHTVWIAPCATSVSGSGTPAAGTPGTPTGVSGTSGVSGSAPQMGLAVVKSERVGSVGAFVRGPVRALVGEQLQYQIVATNTGTTSLNVVVSDPRCDAGTLVPAGSQTIAAGSSLTYTCSHVLLGVPHKHLFRNVAVATGTSPQGTSVGPVKSSVIARVFAPMLRVKLLTPAKPAKPVLRQAGFTG